MFSLFVYNIIVCCPRVHNACFCSTCLMKTVCLFVFLSLLLAIDNIDSTSMCIHKYLYIYMLYPYYSYIHSLTYIGRTFSIKSRATIEKYFVHSLTISMRGKHVNNSCLVWKCTRDNVTSNVCLHSVYVNIWTLMHFNAFQALYL